MANEPVDPTVRSLRAAARSEARLAALLATIAGFVDAYGIIAYGVFVSFMSGNTTQTGYQAAEGAFGPASLSALAILFFVIGTFAGSLVGASPPGRGAAPRVRLRRGDARGDHRPDAVRLPVDRLRDRDGQCRDGRLQQRALTASARKR